MLSLLSMTSNRFIWSCISRRTARSSMSTRQESMQAARRCASGSSESNPFIYSAATSTKLREPTDLLGATKCINVGKQGFVFEL